jgi:hypothetical protein
MEDWAGSMGCEKGGKYGCWRKERVFGGGGGESWIEEKGEMVG